MRMRVVIAVALFSPALARAHEGHEPLPTKGVVVRGDRVALSPTAAKAIGMTTTKVELAEVPRVVRAVASVEIPWNQQAYVTTLAPGRVEDVLVKPGQPVAAGEELARLTSVDLEQLQLQMLDAMRERTLASHLLAQQQSAGNGIAERVVWQSRTEVEQCSARFNVAQQKLRAMGLADNVLQQVLESSQTVRAISITSPLGGIVAMTETRPGEIVSPTQQIFHIIDPSRVWIVARVLEADARHVRPGLGIAVAFRTLPDRRFRAVIDHVELELNPDRTLSVKAVLDNPDGLLKAGMFGRAEIQVASQKEVVCPTSALIRDGPFYYALVKEPGGDYRRQSVVVRSIGSRRAEIEEGLFPGDIVVATGNQQLASLIPSPLPTPASSVAPVPAGITAQGRVEIPVDQKTFASAPIEGRIRRILVEHGQRVRRGDVLAELESLPFETLQLDFLEARANWAQANLTFQRFNASSRSDFIAGKELWKLETRRTTLRQRVDSLRRTLALIGLSESEIAAIEQADITGESLDLPDVLPIRAPADGLVANFELIPGQVVLPQTELFELHNPTKVWVRAFLFEQDASGVGVGRVVQVRLASDPGFRAVGKVERIDPQLLSGNRLVSVWTELDNRDLRMREAMAATLVIERPASMPVARN